MAVALAKRAGHVEGHSELHSVDVAVGKGQPDARSAVRGDRPDAESLAGAAHPGREVELCHRARQGRRGHVRGVVRELLADVGGTVDPPADDQVCLHDEIKFCHGYRRGGAVGDFNSAGTTGENRGGCVVLKGDVDEYVGRGS